MSTLSARPCARPLSILPARRHADRGAEDARRFREKGPVSRKALGRELSRSSRLVFWLCADPTALYFPPVLHDGERWFARDRGRFSTAKVPILPLSESNAAH